MGLISRGDESEYRREIERLQSWCSCKNLELNAREMVVDFRRNAAPPTPIMLGETPVAKVGDEKKIPSPLNPAYTSVLQNKDGKQRTHKV